MRRTWCRTFCSAAVAAAAALQAQEAAAHGGEPLAPHDVLTAWEFTPPIVLLLVGLSLYYGLAIANLWRSAGPGRFVAPWRVIVFYAGMAVLALALLSPLDSLSGVLFSGHMVQHVLLLLVAAPLLALGAPAHTWLWALSLPLRRSMAHWWNGRRHWRQTVHLFNLPLTIWLLSTAVLWLWHVPYLYEAALANDLVHALEHATFLGSAWLFWGAVIGLVRHNKKGDAVAILMVFTAALQSGILGALMTFAHTPWYPSYQSTPATWGLTALEDQQLAGVIMWVPAGTVYVAAALAILGIRLASLDRQAAPSPKEYTVRG